jgi:hypothetical protein
MVNSFRYIMCQVVVNLRGDHLEFGNIITENVFGILALDCIIQAIGKAILYSEGACHSLAALPPEVTRYTLYRRLGGPQGQSERVRKISPPPGFDPRTVQPVVSRYTDWTIPAHNGS